MKNKLKNSQKFSLLTAFYITLLQTLLLSVFLYIFTEINFYFLFYWTLFSFTFSAVLIHLRLEKYVFNSIKKIYKDLTLLESTTFNNSPINTDMATLKKEIDTYAKNKKLELEALKGREEYRKEFIGNVSHELGTPITVIKGYLEAIMDNMQDLDDKWRKPIRQMHQQSSRMENIVKDLLLLSSPS